MRRLVVGAEDTLAQVLRSNLMLTGTKVGCGERGSAAPAVYWWTARSFAPVPGKCGG